MYYEINVARNNSHFFATAPRSITSMATLKDVYQEMVTRFPSSDGFKLSVTYKVESGRGVNMDGYLDDDWSP
jgi:hypothetical protein